MSYYIDIIDTTSSLTQTVLEKASKSGIVLSWNGGDTKDDTAIVSSELKFDILNKTAEDAAFIDFFTGDEHRFKVVLKQSPGDAVIWQGYVLPDLYSEPYKNGCFFVSFTATDGLARLKGKYLPSDYYVAEKSVIDIFCQILQMTGLQLELWFAPAIENNTVKNWHSVYIDTVNFIQNKKQKDAFFILETLLKDTLCVCYQADDRWFIEGINVRNNRKVVYKSYDYFGNFIQTNSYTRLTKNPQALDVPQITMIPPYNNITVSHKKEKPSLPAEISKQKNEGWVLASGVVGEVYATEWMGNGSFYAKCIAPDYNVIIFNQYHFDNNDATVWTQDDTKFVSLCKKVYVESNSKVGFKLDFAVMNPKTGTPGTPSLWNEVMKYEIVFNNTVIYSNVHTGVILDSEKLIFNESGSCVIAIEHYFLTEGLIDIRLYRPIGRVAVNGVLGIRLNKAEINIIDFKEEIIESDVINGDFTINKEIDLVFADDKSGFSSAFRLEKLNETSTYNEIEVIIQNIVPVVYSGKYYIKATLADANLIDKNRFSVYRSGALIPIYNVIYNHLGGEEMLVETTESYTSGVLVVRKYATKDVTLGRGAWSKWTDSFYKIENNSFVKTVVNIFRRLFSYAHERIEMNAFYAVKFNDIVQFNYGYLKNFIVLNCSWNLDENKTDLVLGRSTYKDSDNFIPGDQNIAPIVIAADTVYLNDTDTTASLSATAYDPDGFIVDQEWTKTVGPSGDVIATPALMNTDLSNLTGDLYTYQIQVTDNGGATAIDTINVVRIKDYSVTLDLFTTTTHPANPQLLQKTYKVNISPELPDGIALVFSGEVHLYAKAGLYYETPIGGLSFAYTQTAQAQYSILKDGVSIAGLTLNSTNWKNGVKEETVPLLFSVTSQNEVYITLLSWLSDDDTKDGNFKALANLKLQSVGLVAGIGSVTGLPQERETLLQNA